MHTYTNAHTLIQHVETQKWTPYTHSRSPDTLYTPMSSGYNCANNCGFWNSQFFLYSISSGILQHIYPHTFCCRPSAWKLYNLNMVSDLVNLHILIQLVYCCVKQTAVYEAAKNFVFFPKSDFVDQVIWWRIPASCFKLKVLKLATGTVLLFWTLETCFLPSTWAHHLSKGAASLRLMLCKQTPAPYSTMPMLLSLPLLFYHAFYWTIAGCIGLML